MRITRGTKKLIKNIVIEHEEFDRYVLLDLVCEELVNRYPGEQLDYQLERMRLETTSAVLEAIDYVISTTNF